MPNSKISQLTSATLPLAGTEVLPIVQSSATVKVASDDLTVKNIRSNSTSGILQVTGPAASSTRTMTTPDANFTVARTDAAQTFTGTQTVRAAATQDAVALAGRAGGTSSYVSTVTPTTLSASRTVTLPDANTTVPVATQVLTFSGPTAARTITLPDANFTAARTDAAQTFTGVQTFSNQVVQQTNAIRVVKSTSLSDNVATTLFTITTPNPSSDNDAGVYACRIFLIASFTGASSGDNSGAVCAKSQEVMFTVANIADGTVARSAVLTMHTSGQVAPGSFSNLTDPVVTLNGVSNYVTEVKVTSDGSGVIDSGGQMCAILELLWNFYNSAPTIA